MSSLVRCPACSQRLQLPESKVGKPIFCPKCGYKFAVGTAAEPPAYPEPGLAPPEEPLAFSGASSAADYEPYRRRSPAVILIAIGLFVMLVVGLFVVANSSGTLRTARGQAQEKKALPKHPANEAPDLDKQDNATPKSDDAARSIAAVQSLALVWWVLAVILGAILYFVPTIVAVIRRHPNTAAIVVINFLLGWTLVGFAVALAWAFMAIDRRKQYRGDFADG